MPDPKPTLLPESLSGVLRALVDHNGWLDATGDPRWNWGTQSNTARLLTSLTRRGLAVELDSGDFKATLTGKALVAEASLTVLSTLARPEPKPPAPPDFPEDVLAFITLPGGAQVKVTLDGEGRQIIWRRAGSLSDWHRYRRA